MLISLLFLVLSKPEAPWHLKNTDIFIPLSMNKVVIDDGGNFFILDISESKVMHYDSEGRRLKDVTVRGRGPGEINRGFFLEYRSGKLLVYDTRKILFFSSAGKFLGEVKKDHHYISLEKVASGWIGMKGLHIGQSNDPLQLVHMNEQLEEIGTLATWESEASRKDDLLIPFEKQVSRHERLVNPVQDRTMVARSKDGRYVYVRPACVPGISIFDLRNGKRVKEIDLSGEIIPFHEEWGQLMIDHMNSMSTMKLKSYFPEYFPALAFMMVSVENHLIYWKWDPRSFHPKTGNPIIKKETIMTFDTAGNKVEPGISDHYYDRVVGVSKDLVWFIYTTSEGERTVARCAKDKAAETMDAWSILED